MEIVFWIDFMWVYYKDDMFVVGVFLLSIELVYFLLSPDLVKINYNYFVTKKFFIPNTLISMLYIFVFIWFEKILILII